MTDLEALSYRARGHLRPLVRMRWPAIGTMAALVYFAHTALDVLVRSAVLIACAAGERFGGTIHISDLRGGGTRVQIELPFFRPRGDYRRGP